MCEGLREMAFSAKTYIEYNKNLIYYKFIIVHLSQTNHSFFGINYQLSDQCIFGISSVQSAISVPG